MLLTLAYLHAHDVVHRDLRLEKFVFASQASQDGTERPGSLGAIKLVDLGHAKHWKNKKKTMNAACGSLPYAAPGNKKERKREEEEEEEVTRKEKKEENGRRIARFERDDR